MTLFLILTLGLLFSFSVALGASFQKARLPVILSFFVAGFLVKQMLEPLGFTGYLPALEAFSKFGVVFLLFLVGLKINPWEVRQVGRKILAIGTLQITLTSLVLVTALVHFFNLPFDRAFVLGVALSFSSTIVATKMIYDRGEQDSLYAKVSFGILIIQDIVAVILIMFSSMFFGNTAQPSSLLILQLAIRITAAFLIVLLSIKFLPRLEKLFFKSQELLFLFALGVCLLMAGAFETMHIGYELGALAAGMLLAQSFYQREIASRINPIKNLFLVIYFGYLGMLIDPQFVLQYGHIILAVSVLITWLIKPFITNFLMAFFNFSKHDGFKTSLVLSQISEFTVLVCFAAGFSASTNAAIVAIFMTTVAFSSLFFENSLNLSKRVRVRWWTKGEAAPVLKYQEPRPEIILFGAHRMGFGLIKAFKKISPHVLVVDNNPDVINKLQVRGVDCLFGDGGEADFLETLDMGRLQMVVSTIPDLDTNLFLLSFLKRRRKAKIRVFLATRKEQAERLYRNGANYVILPYELGKSVVGKIFEKRGLNKSRWG